MAINVDNVGSKNFGYYLCIRLVHDSGDRRALPVWADVGMPTSERHPDESFSPSLASYTHANE